MRGSSTADTNVSSRRLRFLFCDFFVRMCLWNAFFRFSRPDAVILNRFLAPLFDFIFGMRPLKGSPVRATKKVTFSLSKYAFGSTRGKCTSQGKAARASEIA